MSGAGHADAERDRQSSARPGEVSQPRAHPFPRAADLTARILHLQRTAGNRAVGEMLREYRAEQATRDRPSSAGAAPIRREPSSGNASTAPGPGKPSYLVSVLLQAPFAWEREPDKLPTIERLNRWLTFYNFHERRPLGDEPDGCDFNSSFSFNIDNVANIFMVDSKAAGFAYSAGVVREAVAANLRPRQQTQARIEDEINHGLRPGPGGPADKKDDNPKAGKDDDTSTQLTIGWTFVPATVHKDVKTGEKSTDPPTLQVTGQFTLQLHKDGQRGFELSAVVQASFFADPGAARPRLQNLSAGGQAAWVTPFFTEFIQLQAVAQVLLGSNFDATVGDQLSGPRLQPSAQAAVGPQVVFTIPGTNKHLQVLGGAQGSVTTGAGTTLDKSAGFGVQWVL